MNTEKVIEIIKKMGAEIELRKEYLTDLDNAIADGDHGINMARGFSAVSDKLDGLTDKDIGTVLKTVGMTLVSAVGGSAGPLYGTAFMKSGIIMNGKYEMEIRDFLSCLKAATDGIMMRGKAVKGEKTMLDAIIPSLDAMNEALKNECNTKDILKCGVDAAWDGVEYTKTIPATKGRASYIGERSIGHIDPGAASYSYLLSVISENI